MSKKTYTLFIFRRDLRLNDNLGLIYAMTHYQNVIPIFIATPEQVGNENKYRSDNCVQFMVESLKDLDTQLRRFKVKLHIFKGDNETVLKKLLKSNQISIGNVVYNKDYTPYAVKRDKQIQKLCEKFSVACTEVEDYLLKPMGTFNKASDGEPYTVFTPFRNNGFKFKIDKPDRTRPKNLAKSPVKFKNLIIPDDIPYVHNLKLQHQGGRDKALEQLNKVSQQTNYNKTRNTLAIPTSELSAYLKFGCISIREAYWKVKDKLGKNNDLVSQLFWREFYYYITYHFPDTLKGQISRQPNQNYNEKYDKVKWDYSKKEFSQWAQGLTGFPIVDAGMHQMNQTGYMHNRARLITANFLNRMLGMDWRMGERYYAQKLYDYDPSVNNGNWQWIASTGVDPKPYFQRLFNPWIQGKKFDPQAKYIKEWLPQLKNIPSEHLLQWDKYCAKYDLKKIGYVAPMVNYKKSRARSVSMYRKAL